ncbi:MAG: hypothetical protein AVDCRST_MAG66-3041 [uncultured Pseudonocardia sp.]|uniref:HTH araC/xylS-type domain-containing protein n=1 Tax=uncultured Pseudonocardia sp. TaxID=211455 RepID=A0A6J4PVK2_9PSEU|nr:MAG: hypothetical protein AVDCRST_MAG66-3041 [uncultured Pseudonocardia sp.]
MAVVLDAAAHPPADRADLVHEMIAGSGVRRRVELNAPAAAVDVRAEAWRMGATQVLRTTGTGLTLTRTARDVRTDAPEMMAIALSAGPCTYSVRGTTSELDADGVVLVDFATPYAFAHAGRRGSSFTTHIPYAELGLDVDAVRAAIPRLASSGLLPLVRGHLVQMRATVDLTRALIVSAAGDRREREVLHGTLRARVVSHIRAHLHERDLTPARIAAVHHVSVRTLYNAWGDQDGSLADWIIRQRLERARRDLALGAGAPTISGVARAWGFVSAAHSTRRFRAAYGVSPREWVHRSRSGGGPPVRPS